MSFIRQMFPFFNQRKKPVVVCLSDFRWIFVHCLAMCCLCEVQMVNLKKKTTFIFEINSIQYSMQLTKHYRHNYFSWMPFYNVNGAQKMQHSLAKNVQRITIFRCVFLFALGRRHLANVCTICQWQSVKRAWKTADTSVCFDSITR